MKLKEGGKLYSAMSTTTAALFKKKKKRGRRKKFLVKMLEKRIKKNEQAEMGYRCSKDRRIEYKKVRM